jgi:ABC-type multidrug transport system ATPase subunit
MLDVRHLVKRYFGYPGPNGSGKTTTAPMVTGLIEPSGGSVLFDGQLGRKAADHIVDVVTSRA